MRSYLKVVTISASGLLLVIGVAIDSRSTLAAYLVAWIAIGAVPIGALGLLMTTYADYQAGDYTTAATSVLPIVAALFLPVLVGMKVIYPAASHAHPLPAFKSVYLAPWFFVLRTVIYFVALWLLVRWQRSSWRTDRMIRSASAGLILYALLVSFAGIDWIESLEPDFHSSIYGLLYLCCLRDRSGACLRTPDRRHQGIQRVTSLDHPALVLSSRHAVHRDLGRQHPGRGCVVSEAIVE